ncbi:ABC transporter permease [Zavarzinia sp. CC-PAN008]|uniref:ABC transporter permease n=1 Tax=Zavarzinia sp. CC-PAN008 TaxID=3243332 RepID=UPI003F744E0B
MSVASMAMGPGDGAVPLKLQLARAERRRKMGALLLVAPLFVFLLATFLLPIGSLMLRIFDNGEIADNLPNLIQAMPDWTEGDLPPESVYQAFAMDLKAAHAVKTTALIGKRLNYEIPGIRSKVIGTGRALDKVQAGPWKDAVIKADAIWGKPETWSVLRREASPFTWYYLLTALDLRQTPTDEIVRNAPDQAIFNDIFIRTFWISFQVTAWTLVLGFPVAYLMARLPTRTSNLVLILVLLPFWTSLLVRTTAWFVLLQTNGPINDALVAVGLTTERLQLIFSRFGTIIAMTHIQLPFTLLPIFSVMKSIPPSHVRAARSLGAGPFYAFWKVYFPQTIPGIGAGCLITFILCLGFYITPALVGGATDQMVSAFIASYMNRDLVWGLAAALGGLLLLSTLVLYFVFNRLIGIDKMRLG